MCIQMLMLTQYKPERTEWKATQPQCQQTAASRAQTSAVQDSDLSQQTPTDERRKKEETGHECTRINVSIILTVNNSNYYWYFYILYSFLYNIQQWF